MMTSGQQQDNADAGRYARLLGLYRALDEELAALEKEGRTLREQIQKAIDRDKMKKILQHIVNTKV